MANPPDSDDVGPLFSTFDAPAYVRRGILLEDAIERLHNNCQTERTRLLHWTAIRCDLFVQSDRASKLQAALHHNDLCWLHRLESLVPTPMKRVAVPDRRRARVLIGELKYSVLRFNRKWTEFLEKLDLQPINEQILRFNKYYLLEKECAVRSPQIAAQGFQKRELISAAILSSKYRTLPVPPSKETG